MKEISELLNIEDNITNEMLFSRIESPDLDQKTGIPFEYLNGEKDDFKKLIECPICLKILNNVSTCGNCAKSFCKNCIDSSLKKSKDCPCCRKEFTENRIMGQLTRNQLDICKFNCFYKNYGCKEIISYSNFFTHINKCGNGDYKCNNIKYDWILIGNKKVSPKVFKGKECKFKGKKKDLIKHSKECGLEKIFCFCCEKEYCSILIKKHCDICYQKTGNCPYCKNLVKLFDFDEHIQNVCLEVEISCDKCNMKFLRKNINNHNQLECLENQVTNLKYENIMLKNDNEIIKKDLKQLDESVQKLLENKRKRKKKPTNT